MSAVANACLGSVAQRRCVWAAGQRPRCLQRRSRNKARVWILCETWDGRTGPLRLALGPRLEMSCGIVRGTAAYHGLSGGPSGRRRGCVSICACVAARCVSVTSVPPPTQPPSSTWCAAAQQRRAVARRHRRILSCGLGAVTRGYSLVCVRSLARVCSLGLRVCGYGATAQPAA